MSSPLANELGMDSSSLYREEVYTDRRVGTIKKLVPVMSTGADDTQKAVLYVGQAQLMSPMGPIPISFDIEADNLADAVNQFAQVAQDAAEKTVKDLQELQRDSTSGLMIPESGGGGGGFGSPGGRGGRIQF